MRPWARLLLVAALATSLGGLTARWRAGGHHDALRVGAVSFVDRSALGLEGAGHGLLLRHLDEAGVRRIPGRPKGAGAARVDAALDFFDAGASGLALRLRLSPVGNNAALRATAELPTPDVAGLRQAVAEGWALVTALHALDRAGPAAWRAMLRDDAARRAPPADAGARGPSMPRSRSAAQQLRAHGLDRLVAAKDPHAGPLLVGLLERAAEPDADEATQALGLRAAGGVVLLRERRAVLPLIALGLRREPAFVVQIVYAVGALGGPQAEAYLVTLASGHAHHEVRAAAREALETMARAQGGGRVAPPAASGAIPA